MKIEDTYYWQQKNLAIQAAKLRRDTMLGIKPYLMPFIERLNTFAKWLAL